MTDWLSGARIEFDRFANGTRLFSYLSSVSCRDFLCASQSSNLAVGDEKDRTGETDSKPPC